MHLTLSLTELHFCGETRHAQTIMQDLGITYQLATPQSLFDSWWFWNCENVPDPLPPYLKKLRIRPKDAVGHGISKTQAKEIIMRRKQTVRANKRTA